MPIKAVLFDKDGTLLDFSNTFGPATSRVIAALSNGDDALSARLADALRFDPAQEACHPDSVLIAGSLDDIAATIAPLLAHDDVRELAKTVDQLYIQHSASSLTAFPFTQDVLVKLNAMNLPLGIATNDSEEAAYAHMDQLELKHHFSFICGFDSGHGGKPQPGMVLAFAEYCALPVTQTAMVGDSTTDMKAARAAGAVAIAVTSGEAEGEDLSDYADHILHDISGLPDLLGILNQKEIQ